MLFCIIFRRWGLCWLYTIDRNMVSHCQHFFVLSFPFCWIDELTRWRLSCYMLLSIFYYVVIPHDLSLLLSPCYCSCLPTFSLLIHTIVSSKMNFFSITVLIPLLGWGSELNKLFWACRIGFKGRGFFELHSIFDLDCMRSVKNRKKRKKKMGKIQLLSFQLTLEQSLGLRTHVKLTARKTD